MSLSIILLIAAASAPVGAADEIVIIAQRLEGTRVRVYADAKGKTACSLSRSTGLARLDEALCKTATRCVKSGAQTAPAVDACVRARKPALLDDARKAMGARQL